jgi:hypothetical protein
MRRDLRALHEPAPANICGIAAAIVGAAGITAIGSVVAGGEAAGGAKAGADAQLQMYNTTRSDLLPYNQAGQQDFAQYNRLITGSPEEQMAALQGLPGYQFVKTQGLKSVQNSAAARGLGVSGAALKGAAGFATGLADTTFGEQANRLLAGATLGENAGAHTGSTAGALGAGIGTALTNAGAAQAAGITGAANNIGSGLIGYGMYGGANAAPYVGNPQSFGIPADLEGLA